MHFIIQIKFLIALHITVFVCTHEHDRILDDSKKFYLNYTLLTI